VGITAKSPASLIFVWDSMFMYLFVAMCGQQHQRKLHLTNGLLHLKGVTNLSFLLHLCPEMCSGYSNAPSENPSSEAEGRRFRWGWMADDFTYYTKQN
jgi:hypothetical protein